MSLSSQISQTTIEAGITITHLPHINPTGSSFGSFLSRKEQEKTLLKLTTQKEVKKAWKTTLIRYMMKTKYKFLRDLRR
jgi:hypothetical protein